MSHNKWLHFALHILIYKYILSKKNKLCHRMQPEKLYNLQTKFYFNNILFVFKTSKTLCHRFSPLWKKWFFSMNKNSFFLVYLFITQYVFFKRNKIYYKMRLETLYSLQRTVYFICILFMFKKTSNSMQSVFAKMKIDRTEFSFFFEHKKNIIKINFSL